MKKETSVVLGAILIMVGIGALLLWNAQPKVINTSPDIIEEEAEASTPEEAEQEEVSTPSTEEAADETEETEKPEVEEAPSPEEAPADDANVIHGAGFSFRLPDEWVGRVKTTVVDDGSIMITAPEYRDYMLVYMRPGDQISGTDREIERSVLDDYSVVAFHTNMDGISARLLPNEGSPVTFSTGIPAMAFTILGYSDQDAIGVLDLLAFDEQSVNQFSNQWSDEDAYVAMGCLRACASRITFDESSGGQEAVSQAAPEQAVSPLRFDTEYFSVELLDEYMDARGGGDPVSGGGMWDFTWYSNGGGRSIGAADIIVTTNDIAPLPNAVYLGTTSQGYNVFGVDTGGAGTLDSLIQTLVIK